jgi:hypothetical protein
VGAASADMFGLGESGRGGRPQNFGPTHRFQFRVPGPVGQANPSQADRFHFQHDSLPRPRPRLWFALQRFLLAFSILCRLLRSSSSYFACCWLSRQRALLRHALMIRASARASTSRLCASAARASTAFTISTTARRGTIRTISTSVKTCRRLHRASHRCRPARAAHPRFKSPRMARGVFAWARMQRKRDLSSWVRLEHEQARAV